MNEFSEVFGDMETERRIDRDAQLVKSGRKMEREEIIEELERLNMRALTITEAIIELKNSQKYE